MRKSELLTISTEDYQSTLPITRRTRPIRRSLISLSTAALLLIGGAAAPAYAQGATFIDGLAAWQNGDATGAQSIWQPLADAGDAEAQYGLGLLLEAGGAGVAADPGLARDYYRQAADGGIVEAKTNLGLIFAQGKGIAADPVRAATLWTEAAREAHNMAQFNLGLAYYSGSGVAQDLSQALGLIYAAAAAELPEAQFALGQFYRLGLGVEQSESEAYFWFNRARGLGNQEAVAFIDAFQEENVPLPDAADIALRPTAPTVLAGSQGAAIFEFEQDAGVTETAAVSGNIENQIDGDLTASLRESLSPLSGGGSVGIGSASSGGGNLGPRVSGPASGPANVGAGQVALAPPPPLPPALPGQGLAGQSSTELALLDPGLAGPGVPGQGVPGQGVPQQQWDMSQFPPAARPSDIPAGSSQGLLWAAWLGSTSDRASLDGLWDSLVPRQPDILTQVQPGVQVVGSGKSRSYRLLAGPFPSKSIAWQVCNAIKLGNPDVFCKAKVIE